MLQISLKIILTCFIFSIQLYGLITIINIWTQDLDIKTTIPALLSMAGDFGIGE
jgi:hypothetical protein